MSLRRRLVGAIAMILLASLMLGGLFTWWHARQSVNSELQAALATGQVAVDRALLAALRSPRPEQYLTEIVSLFDGDRRLVMTLRNRHGETIVASKLAPERVSAPDWFDRIVAGPLEPVRIDLPAQLSGYGSFLLTADPRNEAGKVWRDMLTSLAVLAVFFGLVLSLVSLTLRWALRPLHGLLEAFERIGKGDYGVRVAERGPAEFIRVSQGLNAMAERLGDMELRTTRLREQLQTVQDEERAGLARDLHDEVSPFLFAVDVDSSTIREIATKSGGDPAAAREIIERADAVRSATEHMKKQVKQILGQLRPAIVAQLGLRSALQELVAGMQRRHPDVAFTVAISREAFGSDLDGVIYRVIREGVSNALQHGGPNRIDIAVSEIGNRMVEIKILDDGAGLGPSSRKGYGVTGMGERMAAYGGSLTLEDRGPPGGCVLKATLPLPPVIGVGPTQIKGAAE